MKKALITGVLGQDGSYLAEYLLSLGYEVWGTVRRDLAYNRITSNWIDGVIYEYGDLRDQMSLTTVMVKCVPDEVYNLGGQVFVPTSWRFPAETFDINTGGLVRIMRALEDTQCKARVYQASSSEMFGNVLTYKMKDGLVALNENNTMNPVSPYGVSKYAAHRLVDVYRQKGWHISSGILFNHESPRRGAEMVTRKITRQVAKWVSEAPGKHSILKLGNIRSKRDWGFAGDYVKAMHLMLQENNPDDYVVGTGQAHSVEDFLDAAVKSTHMDLFNWGMVTEINDKAFTRENELHTLVADYSKASNILDWEPETSFEELVAMMVKADISKISKAKENVCIVK
jgi:GDPmannose 4,6-dehydratase